MDSSHLPVFDLSPFLSHLQNLPKSDPKTSDHSFSATLQSSDRPDTAKKSESPLFFSEDLKDICGKIAKSLKESGVLLIKDPRCTPENNDIFIDMMERYFGQEDEKKMREAHPEIYFQVGVTPEGHEIPRSSVDPSLRALILGQSECNRAHLPMPRGAPDRKWRYMWRVGPRPESSKFKELNASRVVPEEFPEWSEVMEGWGEKLMGAVEAVAQMAAIGFGLPHDSFTSLMKNGPHLLAPTGSDLSRYREEGTIFAGFHYDFNFLTIHGRSRFPGLFIWLRDGRKMAVKVPEGCLLVQAGKEMEWLTGGECEAGMHEVVVTDKTLEAVERAERERRSLWRVSSTLFAHIASEEILRPLGNFANSFLAENYPPVEAGAFAEAELSAIDLKQKRVSPIAKPY